MLKKLHIFLTNKKIFRFIYNKYRSMKIFFRDYTLFCRKGDNCLVFMIDGKFHHGGLADRLYGIINIYAICKVKTIPFKLYWIFPFEIQNFLIPNEYDWIIDKNKISYSLKYSKVIVKIQENTVLKKLKLNKQIHVYCNNKNLDQINKAYYTSFSYGTLFNELFKYSESFQKNLSVNINSHLKDAYMGIQLRFMDLLGDFNEEMFSNELSDLKKQELLDLCHNIIKKLNNLYRKKIFLTSDSITFLKFIAERIDAVYFIPGNSTHMDRVSNASLCDHEKTFLDFFLLSSAYKIINVYGHGLYKSGFGEFASKVYNRDFQIIDIDNDRIE